MNIVEFLKMAPQEPWPHVDHGHTTITWENDHWLVRRKMSDWRSADEYRTADEEDAVRKLCYWEGVSIGPQANGKPTHC